MNTYCISPVPKKNWVWWCIPTTPAVWRQLVPWGFWFTLRAESVRACSLKDLGSQKQCGKILRKVPGTIDLWLPHTSLYIHTRAFITRSETHKYIHPSITHTKWFHIYIFYCSMEFILFRFGFMVIFCSYKTVIKLSVLCV